jgi:hypothetical protein
MLYGTINSLVGDGKGLLSGFVYQRLVEKGAVGVDKSWRPIFLVLSQSFRLPLAHGLSISQQRKGIKVG